jgi:hypothetical protein
VTFWSSPTKKKAYKPSKKSAEAGNKFSYALFCSAQLSLFSAFAGFLPGLLS